MPKISTNSFRGLRPSISPRLLPNGFAQTSIDCDLSSGSLKPYRDKVSVSIPSSSNKVQSIYLYTDKFDTRKWLSFNNRVNVERAFISDDTTNKIYYTGDGAPKATDTDQLLQPTPYYLLGVPFPVTAPVPVVDSAGTLPIERIYVVTHLTAWGEESAPSDASVVVSAGSSSQVTLSSIPQSPNNTDHNPVTKIYIYRSVSGTERTALQFVAEVPHGTLSYVDTINDADLPGDLIKTLDYQEPPATLFGLISMANGVMVGFTDYEVCFSEPYQPHSWPEKYKLASVDKIIGGGAFGNRLVICTNRKPFTVVGNHPDSMSVTNLPDIMPCVSFAGIVSMSGGVVFPTPEGLFYVGSGGTKNLTDEMYTEEDWKTLLPEEFSATQWDGKYVAFTSAGGYIFDLAKPDEHTYLSDAATAVHVDDNNKHLHFNQFSGSSNAIYRFHANSIKQILIWKSKEYFYPDAIAFSAGKIYAKDNGFSDTVIEAAQASYDAISLANVAAFALGNLNHGIGQYEIGGNTIGGSDMRDLPTIPPSNSVAVKFYADGVLVHQSNEVAGEIFRMNTDSDESRGNEFEYEVQTPLIISQIDFATSAYEIKQ